METYFIPDGVSLETAQTRVTHMAIGAHQDDLEIFAYHGISQCYESSVDWFAGVTVTDGGGSARSGKYQKYNDEEMKVIRQREQNEAATLGRYSFQAQLGLPSSSVKSASESAGLVEELVALLSRCRPRFLYLHNPADKHDTHVAVLARCLSALRQLPSSLYPEHIYGCEVWRDLDWLADEAKVALPVDAFPELARELIAVFDSQVAGGKDYVNATLGRRRANATFYQSHAVDQAKAYTFALDLMPLLREPEVSVDAFLRAHLSRFSQDVSHRAARFCGE